jgi:PAS domain S-box-containing protein
MATSSQLETAIAQIIAINSTVSEADQEQALSGCVSEALGVESVKIRSEVAQGVNSLLDYVLNTKRPYVDNELSEYSSFPELTGYWSKGQKSCAVIPVMLSGRVVSIIEMLSRKENLFTAQLIKDATHLSYVIALSISARREESKSTRLASYFNAAFDSPVPQMLIAGDGAVIRFNPAAASQFGSPDLRGFKVEELVGVTVKEIKEKTKSRREFISRRGDKNYSIHASDTGGNLSYIVARDVTDKEILSWATSLMGQSYGAGIVLLDPELKVTYATQSMKRIIGYDSSLTISRNIVELVAERDKGAFKDAIAIAQKKDTSGTVGMATDKGIICPINFVISKKNNGYMMLFYDVSAEKYVDSMVVAFSEFLDSSSDIAMRVDQLGYIRYANHAVESALGYDRTELLGKEISLLYPDGEVLERDLGYARAGKKIDNSYTFLKAKDGRSVEATNSIRFFKTGDSMEYVIIARELESKRVMKGLEETIEGQQGEIKKLQGTGELKSQFIYNISHELKTPLTNIIGFSKLLYSGDFGDLNEEQKSHISTIMDETKRLLDMITQVLDAAKLESSKMKLDLADIDMKAMVDNSSIKALEESAKNNKLEFIWKVDPMVPLVLADYSRIIQVFVNLIGNSIKFTKSGSITVEIKTKMPKKGRPTSIECSVIDTGIGVPEEMQHRLFQEFYGAAKSKNNIKQEHSGTGLGLSISKKIVELHGGKIYYDPREGGGSRFWFTLPIKGRRKPKTA